MAVVSAMTERSTDVKKHIDSVDEPTRAKLLCKIRSHFFLN